MGILVLSAFLLSLLVIRTFPLREDFRVENEAWNGLSEFARFAEASPLRSPSALPEGGALILLLRKPPEEGEAEGISDFIRRGGRVLLLDDFGFGNKLLEEMGVGVRFWGKPLKDPLFNYRNEDFPLIFSLAPETEAQELILNHPTALKNAEGLEILASSSRYSFVDENGNGRWDREEPGGPFPVAARLRMGKGELVLISDSSLIINGMRDLGDNFAFTRKLCGEGPLFLDQSHLPESPLASAKRKLEDARAFVSRKPWVVIFAGLLVFGLTRPLWRRR